MSVNFNSDISLLKLCGISNGTISAAGASFLVKESNVVYSTTGTSYNIVGHASKSMSH
jgi:hypothetical protein